MTNDYEFFVDPSRCIGCSNCVLACPFGVPMVHTGPELMMKCDMCYDRTSSGLRPMCATVCPSQALFYGTAEEIRQLRPMSAPTNRFQFGNQVITTRVFVMGPKGLVTVAPLMDVTAALDEGARQSRLTMTTADDAFAEVEI